MIDVRARVAVLAPLHPVLLRSELNSADHQADVVGTLHYHTLTLCNPNIAQFPEIRRTSQTSRSWTSPFTMRRLTARREDRQTPHHPPGAAKISSMKMLANPANGVR